MASGYRKPCDTVYCNLAENMKAK